MTLPAGRFPKSPETAGGSEDGGCRLGGETVAVLDSSVYQDMRWCARCAGQQMFVPVDRFPYGWRGYCLGCEEVVYVMDQRTSEDAA